MGRLNRVALTGVTLVVTALFGTGAARAEGSNAVPLEPGLVASPKGDGSTLMPMRRTTMETRLNTALNTPRFKAQQASREARRQEQLELQKKFNRKAPPRHSPTSAPGSHAPGALQGALELLSSAAYAVTPNSPTVPPVVADLYADPNWALTVLPTGHCATSLDTLGNPQLCRADTDCDGWAPPIVVGTTTYPGGDTCIGQTLLPTDPNYNPAFDVIGGLKKFKDALPGLCPLGPGGVTAGSPPAKCIPVATPDTTTYPGSDYYVIGLSDYTEKLHSDLPATKLRGYYQINTTNTDAANQHHYLGPVILGHKNRPVRVLFVNQLDPAAGGDLFIPMDEDVLGAGYGPDGVTKYPPSRATLHLHGGNTPWISDGTQHQWTAPKGVQVRQTTVTQGPNGPVYTDSFLPAGETPAWAKKGATVAYVPDMWFDASGATIASCAGATTCNVPGATNNPGEGQLTFYWPNQQSGRLMWYHDHAYGTTRLNAYAGEASGFVLVDQAEEDALAQGGVPGTLGTAFDVAHYLPLIIQDKQFVPPAAQLAVQDATWDVAKWGGEGSLWYPHVYLPNQWPDDPTGANANPMGRWDFGGWFWPPLSGLSQVDSAGVVVARPLTVPCSTKALGANGTPGATVCPNVPNPTIVPESFLDTPLVNGAAYPTLTVQPTAYRFQILNGSQERNFNLSFFKANPSFPTEVTMVDAVPHGPKAAVLPLCMGKNAVDPATGLEPNCWPSKWPVDGRFGGVPDPRSAGPKIVQIGSEGGVLPAAAEIVPQPVNYEYNRRNIVVLNVSDKGLFIGPAERADIVVDFSAFAGQTLILYNDAPAPVPAGDPRQDYFTDDLDQSLNGGAPTTFPGYGPNTRTIMQIQVAAAAPAPAINVASISDAVSHLFAAVQPIPVVPQSAYNAAYPTAYTDTYLPINSTSLTFTPACVDVDPAQCAPGTPVDGTPITVNFGSKALHELFDLDFGRMNSLLASEIPTTNFLNQTTIPFSNFDPATEYIEDNKPQMWKVTHNGVDTHTIHFHLMNVQIINRVGWDGQIRPPDANEMGWKESVRMHPLEDIIIALQPVRQTLPWAIPDLIRMIDVTRPAGTTTQFTGLDINNNPIAVTNQPMNFGWEYVWHCHLLGHEEGDMLRAEVFVTAPEDATNVVAAGYPDHKVYVSFRDESKSAQSFVVQKDLDPAFSAPVVVTTIGPPAIEPGPANLIDIATPGDAFYYRVQGSKTFTTPAVPGAVYTATSNWVSSIDAIDWNQANVAVTPTSLSFTSQPVNVTSAPKTATLTNAGGLKDYTFAYAVVGSTTFTATDSCGGVVPMDGSCAISVTFTPTVVGTVNASLAITTSDPRHPSLTVTLRGTSVAPILTATPASLTFANTYAGANSSAQIVSLRNTGTLPLTFTGGGAAAITFTGANPTSFTRTATTCGAGLAVNATCTVTVRASPNAVGPLTAALSIASNALNGTVNVPLAVTGLEPVSLTPASLTFAGRYVGAAASSAQMVTLRNLSGVALALGTRTITGANAADFAVASTTCQASLAANSACYVYVTFTAKGVGARTAILNLASASPSSPSQVTLTGTGLDPLAVTPNPVAFASRVVGTTSSATLVIVQNVGTSAVTLVAPTLVGANVGDFTITNNTCAASLASTAKCYIYVTFTPTAKGARSATLNVNDGTVLAPHTTSLTGTGL